MNKFFLMTGLFFLILSFANAQDDRPSSDSTGISNETDASPAEQNLSVELKRDSETILQLMEELRPFRVESGDSSAQIKVKQSKLAKFLVGINQRRQKLRVDLYSAKATHVDKYMSVTKLGSEQYLRWLKSAGPHDNFGLLQNILPNIRLFNKILEREFRKATFDRCANCFRENPGYELEYVISDINSGIDGIVHKDVPGARERILVRVIRRVTQEDEILNTKIGKFQYVSGNISAVYYNGIEPELLILYVE